MSEMAPDRREESRRDRRSAGPHHRRRLWGAVWITSGAVVVALAIAMLSFAQQLVSVRHDLEAAKTKAASVSRLVARDDAATLRKTAADVQSLTNHALHTVNGPLWGVAAHIPWVGANVSAVRQATAATHSLVADALPPALQLMSALQVRNLKLNGGGINLAPFAEAEKLLPQVTTAFTTASSRLSRIDQSDVLPQVRGAVSELTKVIDSTTPALKEAQRLLPILLPMAGSDGPRNYLLVFENNAEIRATGGIASKLMVLQIDHGRIAPDNESLALAVGAAGNSGHSFVTWPPEVQSIYLDDTTHFMANYTRTPNFPRTAALFSAIWHKTTTLPLNGVISIDPVVLSHMMVATGPLTVDGQKLTAQNVVKNLLSDTYERLPENAASNAYFAAVASAVFDKLSAGKWTPATMISALKTSAAEHRINAWFPVPAEQHLAASAGITGQLPTTNDATTTIGAFLNDQTVGKLEYWLTSSLTLTCDPSTRKVTTTVTLRNAIPSSIKSNYTLGWRDARYGYPRTTMLLDVLLFAPPGATIDSVVPAHGDLPQLARSGTEDGRSVSSVTVAVGKGQTKTVTFTSTLPASKLGPLAVRYSPTVRATPVTVGSSCSALTEDSGTH